jgi:hypothetical protein
MKVEKPHLQIILIVIVLDLLVGIDVMPFTRASNLKLKESRHSKIIWDEYGLLALVILVSLDQSKSIP